MREKRIAISPGVYANYGVFSRRRSEYSDNNDKDNNINNISTYDHNITMFIINRAVFAFLSTNAGVLQFCLTTSIYGIYMMIRVLLFNRCKV